VSREVSRLEEHGLLLSRRLGNTRLVRANWNLPWAGELRSILAQTVGILAALARELAQIDGITEGYVYGSWAARYSGEPGPFPRDIDVLIVGDPNRTDLMRASRAVERHLHVDVNTVVVDPDTWATPETDSFYEQVKHGPLAVIPVRPGHEPNSA
jgi:predicted nucleotidyltransferase